MTIDWSELVTLVGRHQRFLLTSHVRPDCDSLGSELGMAGVLEALGKQVRIVNADAVPEHLSFIDPGHRIESLDRGATVDPRSETDLLIVLDTSSWVQLGPMGDVLRATDARIVVIDHHVGGDDLSAEHFVDSRAESTGRLVVEAAAALGVELQGETARALFAAMATDSGWFRFSSVCGETLRAAGQLIDAGAKPAEIYRALYEQNSLARLRLRGRILARIGSHVDGRLLTTCVTQDDFNETGALPGDTENVVNMLLGVAGSQVAVIFQEQPGGGVKASLRSRGTVDVQQIAAMFGGGGHKAASGVTLDGSLVEAEAKILDALKQTMK